FFLIVFVIAGLLFSPAPAGDWVLGFAGVHLGLGNLLAILTLQFFCSAYFTRKGAPLIVCLTLGWMGTFTNTPGLYVWGLMSMVVILSRRLPVQFYLVPLSLLAALPYNLSLLFGPYAVPAVHTGFHPLKKIIFMLATLGGPFSASLTNATLFGVGGFILFAFAARYCYARARAGTLDYYLLTWILIAAYPLIICFSAGLIRDALGMETALSPRYRFFILPFWMALFVLLRIMLESRSLPSSFLRALWTGCAVVAIIKTWVVGVPVLNAYLDRENSARFTAISLQLDVPDRGWIRNALTATPQDVLNLIPRLKMIQHIPFEPGGEICPPWGQTLQTKTPGNVFGSFDTLEAYQPNAYRISGEVDESVSGKAKIIVANQNAEVRGCALSGYPRRIFGWLRPAIRTGWRGYAKTLNSDSELHAYAFNESTGSWQEIGTRRLK
ncbi:MAG: hypothetical protein J0M12_09685, partial [Deltaproteobacteria bacterium]|nr:hypothetical protein [Deltaproteobacteria bacterium]